MKSSPKRMAALDTDYHETMSVPTDCGSLPLGLPSRERSASNRKASQWVDLEIVMSTCSCVRRP